MPPSVILSKKLKMNESAAAWKENWSKKLALFLSLPSSKTKSKLIPLIDNDRKKIFKGSLDEVWKTVLVDQKNLLILKYYLKAEWITTNTSLASMAERSRVYAYDCYSETKTSLHSNPLATYVKERDLLSTKNRITECLGYRVCQLILCLLYNILVNAMVEPLNYTAGSDQELNTE